VLYPLFALVFARGRLAAAQVFIHLVQLAIFALRNLLAIFALGGAAIICGYRMTAALRAADRLERALASSEVSRLSCLRSAPSGCSIRRSLFR
jgi:hypothetical protein